MPVYARIFFLFLGCAPFWMPFADARAQDSGIACSNVRSWADAIVCHDSDLLRRAREAEEISARILDIAGNHDKQTQAQEQKLWLNRRDRCRTESERAATNPRACLMEIYDQRLALLHARWNALHTTPPPPSFASPALPSAPPRVLTVDTEDVFLPPDHMTADRPDPHKPRAPVLIREQTEGMAPSSFLPPLRPAPEECDRLSSYAACVAQESHAAELDLQILDSRLEVGLRQTGRDQNNPRFLGTRQAFAHYRDTQCAWEAAMTGQPDSADVCRLALTRARIDVLRNAHQGLEHMTR